MSSPCDIFLMEEQHDCFDMVEFVQSFDMGINFLEGPPGPPGPAGEAIFIPSVSSDGWISWTNTAGLPNPDPVNIKGPPGSGGSGDYDDLDDKPSINGVTLSGNKTTAQLLISFSAADVGLGNVANERQYSANNPPPYPVTSVNGSTGAVTVPAVPSGGSTGQVLKKRSATDFDAEWSAESGGVTDYDDLTDKPSINGVTLSGNKTTQQLKISLTPSAAFAIPAAGSSVSYNMDGLTSDHHLVEWGFSASAENDPPADLDWTTYDGYFTITNNGGTTSETIKPVFVIPTAVTLTTHS